MKYFHNKHRCLIKKEDHNNLNIDFLDIVSGSCTDVTMGMLSLLIGMLSTYYYRI